MRRCSYGALRWHLQRLYNALKGHRALNGWHLTKSIGYTPLFTVYTGSKVNQWNKAQSKKVTWQVRSHTVISYHTIPMGLVGITYLGNRPIKCFIFATLCFIFATHGALCYTLGHYATLLSYRVGPLLGQIYSPAGGWHKVLLWFFNDINGLGRVCLIINIM